MSKNWNNLAPRGQYPGFLEGGSDLSRAIAGSQWFTTNFPLSIVGAD
jgi:hypothetical protein